jgi:hypothetical protein
MSMVKQTLWEKPIMTTDKEKLKHLLTGGKLINKYNSNILTLIDGNFHWLGNTKASDPYHLVWGRVNSPNIGDCEIYKESKWYEELPEIGVLVKIVDTDLPIIDRIYSYVPSDAVQLEGMADWYTEDQVIPLTNEEIQEYFFR